MLLRCYTIRIPKEGIEQLKTKKNEYLQRRSRKKIKRFVRKNL